MGAVSGLSVVDVVEEDTVSSGTDEEVSGMVIVGSESVLGSVTDGSEAGSAEGSAGCCVWYSVGCVVVADSGTMVAVGSLLVGTVSSAA